MLTINAEIKKDGLRSDGTYNVKLRFMLDRKMRRLSTSLFVTSKDLTKELKNNAIIYNRAKTKDRSSDGAKMMVDIFHIVQPIIDKYRDKIGKRLFNFCQYYCNEKVFNKPIIMD